MDTLSAGGTIELVGMRWLNRLAVGAGPQEQHLVAMRVNARN